MTPGQQGQPLFVGIYRGNHHSQRFLNGAGPTVVGEPNRAFLCHPSPLSAKCGSAQSTAWASITTDFSARNPR